MCLQIYYDYDYSATEVLSQYQFNVGDAIEISNKIKCDKEENCHSPVARHKGNQIPTKRTVLTLTFQRETVHRILNLLERARLR